MPQHSHSSALIIFSHDCQPKQQTSFLPTLRSSAADELDTPSTERTPLGIAAPGSMLNSIVNAVYYSWWATIISWPLKIMTSVLTIITLVIFYIYTVKMGLCAFAAAAQMITEDRVCDVYVKGQRFSENRVAELIIHPFSFVLPISGCMYLFIALVGLTVVTKLITPGADVNMARTTDGCTPLYSAASKVRTAIVSKLLQHGADKSIRG